MKQLWIDKYRPKTIDEYIWRDDRIKDLVTGWMQDGSIPHVSLFGSPGTGKSSLAELLLILLKVDRGDYLWINSSQYNSVETVRTKIVDFCEAASWSDLRVIVLDEADNFSRTAQQVLRGVIDEHQSRVRFIITGNFSSGVIDPIKSRFVEITLNKLDSDEFTFKLASIVQTELNLDELPDDKLEIISQIVELYYPDLRAAIIQLQETITDGLINTSERNWQTQLIGLYETDNNVDTFRRFVTGLPQESYREVYMFLYNHTKELFGSDKEIAVLLTLANWEFRRSISGFPELNLLGMLLELKQVTNNATR